MTKMETRIAALEQRAEVPSAPPVPFWSDELEIAALRQERDTAEERARALAEYVGAVEHASVASSEMLGLLRRERDALLAARCKAEEEEARAALDGGK